MNHGVTGQVEETPISSIISFDAPTDTLIVVLTDKREAARIGGTLAWRNNNPGNIKHGPFAAKFGSLGSGEGGHAVFPTYGHGYGAMWALLFTDERKFYRQSIKDAMAVYAPASDGNDPIAYANWISRKAGVNPGVVLCDLTDAQKKKMLEAMCAMEGFKKGTVEIV